MHSCDRSEAERPSDAVLNAPGRDKGNRNPRDDRGGGLHWEGSFGAGPPRQIRRRKTAPFFGEAPARISRGRMGTRIFVAPNVTPAAPICTDQPD